jgi:DNA-binding XRE family transcriptional regulator
MKEAPVPEAVFTGKTFPGIFRPDLNRSTGFVFMDVSYLTIEGIGRFERELRNCIARGVTVCVFIQEPKDWHQRDSRTVSANRRAHLMKLQNSIEYLINLGVHVTVRDGAHVKIIVIDYKISYGGSLNALSYTDWTDEEMNRWTDEGWACRTVIRRNFHNCQQCMKEAADTRRNKQSIAWADDEFGPQIAELRKMAGLTQDQLALRAEVDRKTIWSIESGKQTPRADVLVRIFNALNLRTYALAPRAESIVNRLV